MNPYSGAFHYLASLYTQFTDVLQAPTEKPSVRDKALAEQAIYAAWCGRTKDVLLLLRNGVNVNTANDEDCTLVWLAACNMKARTVKALLDNNANPDTSNRKLETPLSAATASESVETVMVLLEHGCLLDTVNRRDETALSIAAKSGSEEIVRALLSRGANANIPDRFQRTPLFLAALCGRTRVVRALLEYKADLDILDSRGRSALDIAEAEKHADIVRELENILISRYEKSNADRRSETFTCSICFDENHEVQKNCVIASIPCGHRVCADCHEVVKHQPTCPQCRQKIRESIPQELFPDRYKLFSHFCVEIPRDKRC